MLQDLRYAVRTLSRARGFFSVAVLTLALGIGAATAFYSVVSTILLRPLPFADSARLVRIVENTGYMANARPVMGGMTYQEFLEWRARATTVTDLVGVMPSQLLVRTDEGTARLWGAMISADAFAVLGARAALGRTLDRADDANPDVVVLGFDAWRRLYRSDPAAVGRTLELPPAPNAERRLLTIVGVLPAGFEFPTSGMEFYTPFFLTEASKRWASVTPIGRLRAAASLQAASTEANLIGAAIRPPRQANAPSLTGPRFAVQSLKDEVTNEVRPALRVFLAAVAVLLVIVCANVANLLLARGLARHREIAVRLALGAGRLRIARQVLAECLVLAGAGGALGAVAGAAGVALVKRLASVEAPGVFRVVFGTSLLPRGGEIGIDTGMFGAAFGLTAVATLLFGVLPAMAQSDGPQLHAMGTRGGGSGRGESRIRAVLVIGQLVMATSLLIGAGLLARSFHKLSTVDRGYDSSKVLALQLLFPRDYSTERKTAAIDGLLERLRAMPDVESAGFTRAGMLIPERITLGTFVPPGRTAEDMRAYPERPSLRPVSPGYLTAMGVRLLEGRDLQAADAASAMPAIVISRSVARQFFPSEHGAIVGQVVDWEINPAPVRVRITGLVDDLRNTSADREPYPEVFIDYHQVLSLLKRRGDAVLNQEQSALGLLSFAIRTRNRPAAAIPSVRAIVHGVDPEAGVDAIVPIDRLLAASVAQPRFFLLMLGVFAAVAGLLAVVGIYGVLAYTVVQRTREIGIRIALGAQRRQVLTLVMGRGVMLAALGISLGLAVAAAGTTILESLLFNVQPLDLTTFVAVAVGFGLVSTIACYLPARRATAVDPMTAIRRE